MEQIMKQIKLRIDLAPKNEVFSINDFLDIASYNTAKISLLRLCKMKIITKIINGLYQKSIYNELIKEFVPLPIDT
ncbi:MAG: DUF6088 family protein, partial [Bacillales bacterium]|nr:DUF6088 family protein [Bacillales bacterium]